MFYLPCQIKTEKSAESTLFPYFHLQMVRMGGGGDGAVVAGAPQHFLQGHFQRRGSCSRESGPNLLQITF